MRRVIFYVSAIMILVGSSTVKILSAGNGFNKLISKVKAPESLLFEGLNGWFPDDWKTSISGGRLVALSPDNTACLLMKTIDLKVLDPNLPDFLSLGEKFVQEFKTTYKLTLLKTIRLPLTFWATIDVPFDWKSMAASKDVPFDWKSFSFDAGSSDIRQLEQSGLKLINAEGVGKLGVSERWAKITLIGLPNGRVLLLFAVSGLEKAVVDVNKQLFGKILLSLTPE
jgi:hypothetical protein